MIDLLQERCVSNGISCVPIDTQHQQKRFSINGNDSRIVVAKKPISAKSFRGKETYRFGVPLDIFVDRFVLALIEPHAVFYIIPVDRGIEQLPEIRISIHNNNSKWAICKENWEPLTKNPKQVLEALG